MEARGRRARTRTARRIAVVATVFGLGAIVPVAAADPPDADFVISDRTPDVNETVTFGAAPRCDTRFRCTWKFGDGATATGRVVRHAYGTAGRRTVTLTVTEPEK